MFVYKITNNINHKVYIGQTIRSIEDRWNQHFCDRNKYDYPLYRAIRKYGKDNFSCELVEVANTIEELNKKEAKNIRLFNAMDNGFGYNILPGGNNYVMPNEVKLKISKSMSGKKFKKHISIEKRSEIARSNALMGSQTCDFTVFDINDNLLYSGSVFSDCARTLGVSVSSVSRWVNKMRISRKYKIITKEGN